jgi:5-oxoprolinase (ATP-hydrolysing) subunit A
VARKLTINADLGEGYGNDQALLQLVSLANVCCGEHAGSPEITQQTVISAQMAGVGIGAHPGFPDRASMGRREPTLTEAAVWMKDIERQTEQFINRFGATHIKFHGALYNLLAHPQGISTELKPTMVALLARLKKPLMGLPGSGLQALAEEAGVPFIREGFADRRYTDDGLLLPRSNPDAVLTRESEIRDQVLRLAETVDSICLHGDDPNAVTFASWITETLDRAGIPVERGG